MKKRIALITHEVSGVGGLPTMVAFLYHTLRRSGVYEPGLISLSTSAADNASLRLSSPATWSGHPQVELVKRGLLDFQHVGVFGSELEFQRYRPRRMLTEILRGYDLLQFVVGSAPWVYVARDVGRPITVWAATTTHADRESQIREASLGRRTWASLMIPLAAKYERHGLEMARSVFALSEYTKKTIASISPATDVAVAPCGVDTDLFRPATTERGDYILCVARLSDPRKNVGLLLESYSRLLRRVQDVPDLYLVGEPLSDKTQSNLQRLELGHKVKVLGPREGEELAQLYRNARLFVLSSNEEGLGIVILEAMASGLPVVSTACGGPATAVRHGLTGFLTPVGDAESLANAMEELLRDPVLSEQMGREGRRLAEERFSLSAAGKVFLDKYHELLDEQEREARDLDLVNSAFADMPVVRT